ncbi:MAG: TonB-dependent receptor [Bacteroidetes bacterium]|nr:MAG: TonB-dependent receptor [Bacteroidota bacterium]
MKQIAYILLLLLPVGLLAQRSVKGTVTDVDGPLTGVSILAVGSSTGTITDLDGNYDLTLPPATDSLEFSYIGYTTQKIAVAGRSQIDLTLSESTQLLEQVVVIGYGSQKKGDLTGAVSVVESKDLDNLPTQSLGQALQGKVTGLQIIPTSGAPGADAIFRIRGVGTLNDADPLFVVDGMIVNDISFINPQDVASVSVLKDASATSIYGARGANGVIIITTKLGNTDGRGNVNLSAYTGTQEITKTIDLVNAQQYATLINEADVNEGRQPRFANPDQYTTSTNWQDEVLQTAAVNNVQLSFNGGNQQSQYNFSVNYFGQDGIIKGSDFDRITTRFNNQLKVKSWLTVASNVSLGYTTSNNINGGSILLDAYRADPLTPAIDSLGNFGNTANFGSTGNPVATIFYTNNKSQGYRVVGNTYADVSFLKHFTFRTNFGLDYVSNSNKDFVPVFQVSPIQQNQQNRLSVSQAYYRNWLWENTLSYANNWGDHQVDGLAGLTYQDNFGEFLSGSRQNLVGESPDLQYLNAGEQLTSLANNGVNGGDWGLVSYLGRVNYTFASRYLLTLAGRIDGSSRFGANNRYGVFPSVGLGWNISNEPFFQQSDLLSRLKLRFSWGRTGNDRIGDYRYTALVNTGLGAVFGANETLNQGSTLQQLANPDIRWEETTQLDLGLEAGFFDNKLQLEIDAYQRTTAGILFAAEIPDYLGASAPTRNIAEVLNQGIDIKLDWRQKGRVVRYGVGVLGSILHNEVLKVDDLDSDLFGGGLGIGGQLGTNSRAGFPVGAFYGLVVEGVFQNAADLEKYPTLGNQVPGDLRFADLDGDGIITAEGDRTILGSAIPDFILGANAFIEVAGFDLNVDFVGQFGNEVINAKKMSRFGAYNFESSFLDRWTGEGTSNSEPRVTFGGTNIERLSSRFVEDGSYIRLRNLQLGYTLPVAVAQRIYLQSLRVYVSGTNLWTSTDFTGYNPEIYNGSVFDNGIDRGTIYPISKTINVGIDIQF